MFAGGRNARCTEGAPNGGRADEDVFTLGQKFREVRIVATAIVVRLIQCDNLLLQGLG